MSNRIAVFNDGIVQQLSTPADLYERPVNSFVAQFIGENNELKGTVAEIGAGNVATVELETGEMVKALAINAKEKGSRTLLSIRPERVEINPTAQTADVILSGRIAELIYLGDHIRARLEVAGHDDFIVERVRRGRVGPGGGGPSGASGLEGRRLPRPRLRRIPALSTMAASRRRRLARWLAGLGVAALLTWPLPHPRAQTAQVDLALVLAVDCSFSVKRTPGNSVLQMEGLGPGAAARGGEASDRPRPAPEDRHHLSPIGPTSATRPPSSPGPSWRDP